MQQPGRPSILVAGAINTDLVAVVDHAPDAGETLNGRSFAIHGGGKAANQAVAIARWGGLVHLVGAVGADDFGAGRVRDLDRDRVGTNWVLRDEQATSGVALIFVETGGENRIVCVPGAALSVTIEHALAAMADIGPSWLLATNELGVDVLAELFQAAHAQGIRVAYNAAPVPETGRELLSLVDILIVNRGEAAALLGQGSLEASRAALAPLHGAGIETIALTLGAEGVFVSAGGRATHVAPPAVEAVDSTGAGDTFCGTLVASLADGESLDVAVTHAVHASALSVTRPGAQSSIPTREDVVAHWPDLTNPS